MIPILTLNSISNKMYCKMCVNTKLTVYDKDENIWKCRTCGSLFKYNEVKKDTKLTVDPELDNVSKSVVIFVKKEDKKEKKENELGSNYSLINVRDF